MKEPTSENEFHLHLVESAYAVTKLRKMARNVSDGNLVEVGLGCAFAAFIGINPTGFLDDENRFEWIKYSSAGLTKAEELILMVDLADSIHDKAALAEAVEQVDAANGAPQALLDALGEILAKESLEGF